MHGCVSVALLLTAGAERDLDSVYHYIAEERSERAADRVLDRLRLLGA
ncbi:MAG: hypothetical protein ACREM1_02285 [Longimicrobiales bacterium]